ncbi:MAG TPA: hypothetical protein ENI36_02375 [Thermoplasmatales archaeon]|nr:hypothetical protein [Thermoplasmatales archaeon]
MKTAIAITLTILFMSSCYTTSYQQRLRQHKQNEGCNRCRSQCSQDKMSCNFGAKTIEEEYTCKVEWKQCTVSCYGREYV